MIISNLNQKLASVNHFFDNAGWRVKPVQDEAFSAFAFLGNENKDGCLMIQCTNTGFFVQYWYLSIKEVLREWFYDDEAKREKLGGYRKKLPQSAGTANLDSFDALVEYSITAIEEWEDCAKDKW